MMTRLLSIRGKRTPADFHRQLGQIMWEYVGMSRDEAGMRKAKEMIPKVREEFWENLTVPGSQNELNPALERANRVADFLEFAELLVDDALSREESCGCHFNVAFQTEEHEALRRDDECSYAAAWEYGGAGKPAAIHKEPLIFEYVELATRSYK
jgi:succinate dehydrogenase / fumarate reductase flavoprotein subunit